MANHRLSLTGCHFGDLEVLGPAGVNARGATMWHCRCHRCGAEVDIVGHRLTDKRNPKRDCGCAVQERRADLTGRTYGAVEVLRRVGASGSGDVLYLVRCQLCGQEKTLPACTIRKSPHSCGCQQCQSERMAEMSRRGVERCVVDGVNVYAVYRQEATARSQTGIRGVYPDRNHTFRAACTVHGEHWIQTGFTSIEAAKEARDKMHAELIAKYKVKPPEKTKSEGSK